MVQQALKLQKEIKKPDHALFLQTPSPRDKREREGVEKNWECFSVSFLSRGWNRNIFLSGNLMSVNDFPLNGKNTQSHNLNVNPTLLLTSSFATCKLFSP